MGMDYSSGIGYGIAVELNPESEEALKNAICTTYNLESEESAVTIAVDEAWSTFDEAGLDASTEGNSWSGPEFLVFMIKGTRISVNRSDSGIKLLTERAKDVHRLVPLVTALKSAGVPFQGPGWLAYQSVF